MNTKEKVAKYFREFNRKLDCSVPLLCWYNDDFVLLQHVGHPSYVGRFTGIKYCTSYFILVNMNTIEPFFLNYGSLDIKRLPKGAIYYFFEGRLTNVHKKKMEEIAKTEIIINKLNLYQVPLI